MMHDITDRLATAAADVRVSIDATARAWGQLCMTDNASDFDYAVERAMRALREVLSVIDQTAKDAAAAGDVADEPAANLG